MTIDEQFLDQLTFFERLAPAPPELLPSRLASSCYEILPIAGAAISVFTSDGFRFPVGASSHRAAYAERLQFTTGEGPCLDLRAAGDRILADQETISRCWPRFHATLLRHTPYRAVAALPLNAGTETWATVDFFFGSEDGLTELSIPDAVTVVDLIGSIMVTAYGDRTLPRDNPISAARQVTMTAMAALNTTFGLTAEQALAALRRHATNVGMTVDALADALVHQRRPLDEVPRPASVEAPTESANPQLIR